MKLNAEQEKVLIALHNGHSTPEKVSKHAGLSEETVKKLLIQLKEFGMIKAHPGLRRSSQGAQRNGRQA